MSRRSIWLVVATASILWLAAPALVFYPQFALRYLITECADGFRAQPCKDIIQMFGQSGDIFGASSAIFAGIALIGVALSLIIDVNMRLEERKPLLVSTIDADKEIFLDEPSFSAPRAIRFSSFVLVKAAGETALNVRLQAKLTVGSCNIDLGVSTVETPLLSGATDTVSFAKRLDEQQLDQLIAAWRQGTGFELSLKAQCNNIEGKEFVTNVVYLLSVPTGDEIKIKEFTEKAGSEASAWAGNAALNLTYKVKPRSWSLARA